jgi:type I restriction-modification system DNA methylase subunit
MALFQTSVLKKYLAQQDTNAVDKAYRKYTKFFLNLEIQQNIDKSNEEQIQATFLTELFVNVLDYTINPKPKYNLTTEYKNEKNNRKADGAIITDEKTVAVVELKGTNTKDLESIRRQAFDYKVNHKGCRFVITSNFEKLRFYIDDTTELLDFDLFNLTRDDFGLLYLCLYKDNLLKELPLQIKQDSLIVEEQITKEFYKDYSLFKRELYRDLVKKNGKVLKVAIQEETGITDNAEHQSDLERLEKNVKLTLFKKSQKLIDRFLFIFFAEDRGLLQPNYTIKRLAEWDTIRKLDVDEPLYDRFKKHFNYLDKGRKGDAENKEIFAYNGGLFKPDSILDRVIIDDDLLYHHTKKLATYDFESQVDVNILGHIFENSLNEIESINAEIEGGNFDKQKSKRKKDGVFYTPKYITKYIVENTVGKLCDEKKAELGFKEEEYFKGRGTGRKKRNDKTIQKLVETLDTYRDWLLQITICDPACGSGAFLNQALDFLIKEHQYIDELKTKILGGGLQFPDIENTILENNIYGVDLNEESVEIAKLSLWLRTAQPRRKLNDLSSNIKCGNSLIDSKTIAGDKAFNWETAFAKVFANGGFDVVIGNPPYGAGFSKAEKKYLNAKFKNQSYQLESYLIFVEKTLDLIKDGSFVGYIMPNTWLSTLMTDKIRNFTFNSFQLKSLVHYDYFVFDDATVETDTYILKFPYKTNNIIPVTLQGKISKKEVQFEQDNWIELKGKPVNINQSETSIKIAIKCSKMSKLGNLTQIVQGTKPFQKGKGKPKQTAEIMKLKPFVKSTKVDETFMPLLRGSLINRYSNFWNDDYWISYGDWLAEPRYSAKFEAKEKLVVRQTGDSIIATYDEKQFICRDNLYIIRDDAGQYNLKALLAILNSKFITWYYRNILNPEQGKAMAQVKRGHLQEIPIPRLESNSIEEFTKAQLEKHNDILKLSSSFQRFFKIRLEISQISKKLENWQDLDFGEFIKELNKAIKATNKLREKEGQAPVAVLTKTDEFEWLDLFEQNKKKAQDLQSQINTLEQQIDAMVYELYGLSDEEIRIVENG